VDILGFTISYARIDQGFYYLERQGVEIMLEQLSNTTWKNGKLEQPFGRGMHFQIMTTGLDKLYQRCTSSKASIFRQMEEAWYRADDVYFGQKQFIVIDPDGFMLRFCEKLGERTAPPTSGRIIS